MQVVEEKVSGKPVSDTNILSQRRTSLTPSGLGKKELIQAWREKASDEAKLLDSLSPTSIKSDKKDDGTIENIGEYNKNEESPRQEHDIFRLGEIPKENSSSYEIESELSTSSYASVSESEDHEQKSLIRRRSSKSVSNSRKSSANDIHKTPNKPIAPINRRSQSKPPPPRYSMSDVDDRHDIEIIKEQLNPLRRSSENKKFNYGNSNSINTSNSTTTSTISSKKSPDKERSDSKPTPKKQTILIGDYQLGEVLGRGASGVVYQGLNVKTGDFVAVKQVAKRVADEEIVKRELNILRSIQHPNIIKVIDCVETSDKFNLIFEYIENGSLTDILQNFGAFPEALVAFYTQQLLQGLAHVHEQGLIHRDIKASNVLVGKDGVIKLSDFGVASTDDNSDNKNLYGSPYWMAPEVIETNTYYKTSDIWSVGCTVIELLTCNPPYFDISPPNAMFKIVSDIHPPLPDPISQELKDFLLKCFERDPSKRCTAKELINHPWICSGNTKSQRSSKAVPLRSFDDLRTVLIEYNQNNKQRIQTLRGTFKYPSEENINIEELLHYQDSTPDLILSPSPPSLTSLSKENHPIVLKEGILKSKHKYWCCIQENFPALAYYKKKEHYVKGKSPKGQILLLGCTVKKSNIVKKEPFGFVIQQRDNRRYFLAADTEEEQLSWVDTILKVEATANAATSSFEKIRKQEEIIKKLQNALQMLIDEKEGKYPSNNLKRPNEAFYKEFFFFLALSVKRNHSDEDTRDINIHDLYEIAQKENIPFHTWYIWIPQQFANHKQK